MKLLSLQTECAALRTITSGNRYGPMLLGVLSSKHFHDTRTRECFERLTNLAARSDIPSLAAMYADPVLSEEARVLVKSHVRTTKPAQNSRTYKEQRAILDKYLKLRILAKTAKKTLEALAEPKVDLDVLLDNITNEVAHARRTVDIEQQMFHIGAGNNMNRQVKEYLKGKVRPFIPTGFQAFDEESGGFREGALVILSANTGGLKSSLAKELANNMYSQAMKDVAYVSLEMDLEETVFRLFASRTGIHQWKFLKGTLSSKEKKQAWENYRKMSEAGEKAGCRFTILPATEDSIGIDSALATLRPYQHKVIFIDYITLLADSDSQDQWKALGYVARKAKMYAKKNACAVVLLTQLSEDDKIRYSRTILEHADLWWHWRITDRERESGVFTINQGKARNQRVFSFELGVDFATNKIFNLEQKMMGKVGRKSSASGKSTTVTSREQSYLDDEDISFDEANLDEII